VPRYRPGDTSAESRLRGGQCDAALLVGHGATDGLSAEARAALNAIPLVEIAPKATRGVAIDSAPLAVATTGTVMRCDGVILPMRPVVATDRPEEATILKRLREAIAATEAAR
jgi:formylmethanofuran dehydrogenase subunit B